MEKVKLGVAMATRWTDPTMCLIMILPYLAISFSVMGYFGYASYLNWLANPNWQDETFLRNVALSLSPWAFTWFWWNVLYHGLGTDKSVDTSKFVTFRKSSDANYWRHRRIPMCELVELYIEEKFDWNKDCEDGDCYKILSRHRHEFVNYKPTWRQIKWLLSQFFPTWMIASGLGKGSSSGKSIAETTKEIDEHYNKGNDVFSCILGKAMVYTCGIFHKVPEFASSGHNGDYAASAADGTLEQAQFNKMQMICEKLLLKKGESLLDVGCGWGTLGRHAVKEFGAKATGVTLSREGKIYCDMASERTGIPMEVLHCDYREIPEDRKFDKISCVEMAEHVGVTNFVDPFLKKMKSLLKNKDSIFYMQVAGLRQGTNWQDLAWGLFMGKFTFPGADASTPLNWYIRQCELAGFEVHSVETIGRHYSHTLHKWYDNWMSHKEDILSGKIDAISEHSKGQHLFRLQEFTWAYCTIAAGISATCYMIVMHPNTDDYPRDQWVDARYVGVDGVVGIGLGKKSAKETGADTPVRRSERLKK